MTHDYSWEKWHIRTIQRVNLEERHFISLPPTFQVFSSWFETPFRSSGGQDPRFQSISLVVSTGALKTALVSRVSWWSSTKNLRMPYGFQGSSLSANLLYIYGCGSKNPLDRPAVIRTSGTRGLRKGAWSRGLQGAKWYDMKCLHESVARPKVTWKGGEIWKRSSKFHGLWINSFKQWRKPNNHKFLIRMYTELVVVWIGSGSVWMPGPRIEPTFLCMLQLGCSVTRKGQQGEGSKWTPWLLGSLALQQCQLGS